MKDLVGRYAHLWEDKGGIFSLAQGVVYWEPPPSCQEALLAEFSKPGGNNLHTYGPAQGIPELTDALTNKIAEENGLTDHSVMVTVGANQAYVNTVLTCLCEDSKAIVFAPYYFNHVMALQMCCGADSVVVGPCTDEGIPDLTWLETTLKSSSQSIDMVTIVNPGNPTGVSLSKDLLRRVVDLCEEHSVWLVLDCTYEYFTRPDYGHQPIATFPDAPHVIHIFSFSKSYALAGYRCGYICLSNNNNNNNNKQNNNNILSNMLKVQDTLPIGPPRVSQIAALGALRAGNDWVRDKYATLDASRDVIFESLRPLKLMGGSGAMYVMAQLPPPPPNNNDTRRRSNDDGDGESIADIVVDDVKVCRQLVKDFGVAIIPGTYCGAPGWIRVCYANLPPDLCRQAAERLREGLRSILLFEDQE
jgi:aspartate/methionine/tyrosine aminotransferase